MGKRKRGGNELGGGGEGGGSEQKTAVGRSMSLKLHKEGECGV